MTEKEPTVQEYFKGFPEAPASDTFRWTDGLGVEHMTTIRAWNGGTLYEQVAKFVAHITETGGKPTSQPAPKPSQAAPAPAGDAPPPAQGHDTSSVFEMEIAKIKVEPQSDGRIVVNFMQKNHNFADIKAYYKTPANAVAAFVHVAGFDEETFSKAGEFSLSCLADWRNSEKLNSKGNPYKNLVNLRPIAGA